MWEGKRCSNGKPKPVTLANTVVARKTAVSPFSRFRVSNPNMTINPKPIPARLTRTCRKVYVAVDMPRIMMRSFPKTKMVRLFARYVSGVRPNWGVAHSCTTANPGCPTFRGFHCPVLRCLHGSDSADNFLLRGFIMAVCVA